MTEAEGAPIAELLARIDSLLEMDKDPEMPEVQLHEEVRADLVNASNAVWQMCTRKQQNAEKQLEVFSLWKRLRSNRDFQMQLVDERGKPLDNPIKRHKPVPEKNAEQLAAEAKAEGSNAEGDPRNPAPTGGHTQASSGLNWNVAAAIPEGVRMGILAEAQNGLTRVKVINKVVKDTSHTQEEVKAWFDTLEKRGHLVANIDGKTYKVVVDPTKAVPNLVSLAFQKALELGMDKDEAISAVAKQHFAGELPTATVLWDDLVSAGSIAQCGANWIWATQPETNAA